jgi:PAS domain S-box-containing protein
MARILIVEDNRIVAEDIKLSLLNMGYEVCGVASSGEDALAVVKAERPDLVLMDIMLAGDMDGIAAAREVRMHFDTPVIFLTAYADKEMLQRAKQTEPLGYLVKPFQDLELQAAVENALYKHAMEMKLKESEAKFHALFSNMGSGVAVYNAADYGEDFIIVDLNAAGERITNTKQEDITGKSVSEVFPGVRDFGLFEVFQRVWRTGTAEFYPASLYQDDHLLFWTENYVYKLPSGEVVAVFDDVTERKRAEAEQLQMERQLQQARKAESLGRMAGAIAHHFNNKLMAVMGNLELALMVAGPNEVLATHLLNAQRASFQAAEVSSLMLAYLGQVLPKAETFDLAKLCREVIETQRRSIPQRVTMSSDFPPHGPSIKANQGQVRQVLANLIVNAWEAIGEGEGEIRASLRIVKAAETSSVHIFPGDWKPETDLYACLEVSDTGHGIDPGQLDLVFDPFFSTRFTGRGLGLAVVLGAVRAYGGAVAVASEPGRGSIFRVFWPVAEPEIQTPQEVEKRASRPIEGLGLVLFVDDEAQLRSMAEIMLGRLGFEVIKAGNGLDAVEFFQERKDEISLVILDLTMPGMSGWETLEALRALRSEVPVVLASGYDEASVMEGKHAQLPQAFLHKPYNMAELKAALGAAMEGVGSNE